MRFPRPSFAFGELAVCILFSCVASFTNCLWQPGLRQYPNWLPPSTKIPTPRSYPQVDCQTDDRWCFIRSIRVQHERHWWGANPPKQHINLIWRMSNLSFQVWLSSSRNHGRLPPHRLLTQIYCDLIKSSIHLSAHAKSRKSVRC